MKYNNIFGDVDMSMFKYLHKIFIALFLGVFIIICTGTGLCLTASAAAAEGSPSSSEVSAEEGFLYGLIPFLSTLAVVFVYRKVPHLPNLGVKKGTGNEDLDKIIAIGGYSYDPQQDIFYSNMDAWQREFGYCRLYDEAATPLRLIMDCEPIYFDFKEKHWLIEF
jgi:hypothetical protein